MKSSAPRNNEGRRRKAGRSLIGTGQANPPQVRRILSLTQRQVATTVDNDQCTGNTPDRRRQCLNTLPVSKTQIVITAPIRLAIVSTMGAVANRFGNIRCGGFRQQLPRPPPISRARLPARRRSRGFGRSGGCRPRNNRPAVGFTVDSGSATKTLWPSE